MKSKKYSTKILHKIIWRGSWWVNGLWALLTRSKGLTY